MGVSTKCRNEILVLVLHNLLFKREFMNDFDIYEIFVRCVGSLGFFHFFIFSNAQPDSQCHIGAKSGQYAGGRTYGRWRWRLYYPNSGFQCVQAPGPNYTDFPMGDIIFTNRAMSVNSSYVTDVEAWQENSAYNCDWTSSCGSGSCDFNSGLQLR